MRTSPRWFQRIALSTALGALCGVVIFLLALFAPVGQSSAIDASVAKYVALYRWDVIDASARLMGLVVAATGLCGIAASIWLLSIESLSARRFRARTYGGATVLVVGAFLGLRLLYWFELSPGTVARVPGMARFGPVIDRFCGWTTVQAVSTLAVASLLGPIALALGRRGVAMRGSATRFAVPVSCVAAITIVLLAATHERVRTSGKTARKDSRPNVVLLMSDSLRSETITATRRGQPVMPTVAALASRGVSFRSYFVPIARTAESVVTMMTGTYAQDHGIRPSWVAPRTVSLPTLPRLLREAGYETVLEGDWCATDFVRFDVGFERANVPPELWSVKNMLRRGRTRTQLLALLVAPHALVEAVLPEAAHRPFEADATDLVMPRCLAELDRLAAGDRPFFLTVFTGLTHLPFVPRGCYARRFTPPDYAGTIPYSVVFSRDDRALSIREGDLEPADLAQIRVLFDAAARSFDDAVLSVLDRLESLGLADNTIVIVTSDHGISLFDSGCFGQGLEIVTDASNRVPLVLHDPTRARHADVDHVVREVDLAPTILDLLSVPVPPTMEGTSLRSYMDDPVRDQGRCAYGETGFWTGRQPWEDADPSSGFDFPRLQDVCEVVDEASGVFAVKREWARLGVRAAHRMVRTDDWKLVYWPRRDGSIVWKLFDARNADFTHDVAPEHPEVVARLRPLLEEWLKREDSTIWQDPLPRR